LAFAGSALAVVPTLPTGFQVVTLADNFAPPGDNSIMDVAWASDGRMFAADRGGYVFVHKPTDPPGTNQLVLDISGHVNDAATTDHGLLGIATDKDFATNGYLYLLYTYDETGTDDTGRKVSTLRRVTIDSTTNTAVGGVNTPAETTIIGQVPATIGTGAAGSCGAPSNTNDCIPSEGSSHSIGSVRVASDGTLFVGTGDGNDYTKVDPLTFNDNNPQTYSGKIMHIAPNGNGLPGHPFCPADSDLTHVCTKIYAMGLRNPFRFTVRPAGGLAIGDVGENAYEELDLSSGGEDFGWPCWEGVGHTPFQDDSNQRYDTTQYCMDRYALPNTTTAPAYSWSHLSYPIDQSKCNTTVGNTAIGGPTYTGDQYPAGYRGTIFFGDWTCRWIGRAVVSGNTVSSVQPFASGWHGGVDLLSAPDGNIAYVDDTGVHEIVYGPGNHAPSVAPTATPSSGAATLPVTFHANGSDPDSDSLTYDWDFGDGSAHGSGANPSHSYTSAGNYTATVTADDGRGMTASDTVPVTVTPGSGGGPDQAPSVAPTATPSNGLAPLAVSFQANGSDPDNDPLAYDWDFGDGSAHGSGASPSHSYVQAGNYTATVTADDGRGMTATDTVAITVTAPGVFPFTPPPASGVEGIRARGVPRPQLSATVARLGAGGLASGSFVSTKSVRKLDLSVWRGRANASSCRWWSKRSRALKRGACGQPHWMAATLHRTGSRYTWTLDLGAALPLGSYTLVLRALPRSSALAPSERLYKRLRVR
jgi:PKD repeat protein